MPDSSYAAKPHWDRKGNRYDAIKEDLGFNFGLSKYMYYQYVVYGLKGAAPGNGGDGGMKGFAGLEGKTNFVGIKKTPNFTIFNEKGKQCSLAKTSNYNL